MNDRRHLAVVPSRGDDEGSGIQGLENAREVVLEFLAETIGKVKTGKLLGQLFQQGLQGGKPFLHFPFELDDDYQDVANDVVEAAEKDISQCGDDARILYSFRLDGHDNRCNFELKSAGQVHAGRSDLSEHEGDIMIPRASHLIQQQMQHNQIFAQLLVSGSTEQIKGYQEEIRELRKRCQFLETERTKYLDSREEILSLQHERDMKIRSQEKNDHRIDQLMSVGMNAAGPIVNKFVKQKIMPEKVTPLEGMMFALAQTMDAPQLKAFMESNIFDIAQRSNFMEILKTIHAALQEDARRVAGASEPNGQG